MKTLRVNLPERAYDIHIEHGLLAGAGELIKNVFHGEKITVVTDSNVGPLYGGRLQASLEAQGFRVHIAQIPAGEASKCASQLFRLYDEMLAFGMTRTDLVIALGGGVVGDLAGYAAASLLRGIPFIQIPTTVLAQVDSSVGGKVAIDLPQGKNLVGAFYQPKLVLIDPECLRTLNARVLSDGMAEVIKYGAIRDAALFERLENIKNREELFAKIGEIVYTCCDIKRCVVEEDELDTGGRMILNFGHTFGHAIEKQYHYETYTHGSAVAAGMCMMTEKTCTPELYVRLCDCVKAYDLPTEVPASLSELVPLCGNDKKRASAALRFIVCETIGKAEIRSMPFDEFAVWMGGDA